MRIPFIMVVLVSSASLAVTQEKMAYENRNQVDPGLFVVRSVWGRVTDAQGAFIPGVDIGVFTESEHKLVLQTVTDSDGYFKIEQLPKGDYRLVVHYDPFCPANARIQMAGWPKGGVIKARRLRVHLIPPGLDDCSWVSYK